MKLCTWTDAAFIALLAACNVALSGCLPTAPTTAVTPTNRDRVQACQTIATEHNGYVIGDVVVSAFGTIAAGVGAALPTTNTTIKDSVTAAAAGLGGSAMAGAALTALTASSFANSHCSDVVGDLPLAPDVPAPASPQMTVTGPRSCTTVSLDDAGHPTNITGPCPDGGT